MLARAAQATTNEERAHAAALSQFVIQLTREDQDRLREAIVFRRAQDELARGGGDLWEVGTSGETRLVSATSLGVLVAHRALCGERPPADKASAHAVRVTAAAWAARAGCPRLVALMPLIAVRAGCFEYLPGPRPPLLVLR